MTVWLLATRTDLTHREIAAALGTSSNQVSLMLHFLRKAKFGAPLDRWIDQASFWLADDSQESNPSKADE